MICMCAGCRGAQLLPVDVALGGSSSPWRIRAEHLLQPICTQASPWRPKRQRAWKNELLPRSQQHRGATKLSVGFGARSCHGASGAAGSASMGPPVQPVRGPMQKQSSEALGPDRKGHQLGETFLLAGSSVDIPRPLRVLQELPSAGLEAEVHSRRPLQVHSPYAATRAAETQP